MAKTTENTHTTKSVRDSRRWGRRTVPADPDLAASSVLDRRRELYRVALAVAAAASCGISFSLFSCHCSFTETSIIVQSVVVVIVGIESILSLVASWHHRVRRERGGFEWGSVVRTLEAVSLSCALTTLLGSVFIGSDTAARSTFFTGHGWRDRMMSWYAFLNEHVAAPFLLGALVASRGPCTLARNPIQSIAFCASTTVAQIMWWSTFKNPREVYGLTYNDVTVAFALAMCSIAAAIVAVLLRAKPFGW